MDLEQQGKRAKHKRGKCCWAHVFSKIMLQLTIAKIRDQPNCPPVEEGTKKYCHNKGGNATICDSMKGLRETQLAQVNCRTSCEMTWMSEKQKLPAIGVGEVTEKSLKPQLWIDGCPQPILSMETARFFFRWSHHRKAVNMMDKAEFLILLQNIFMWRNNILYPITAVSSETFPSFLLCHLLQVPVKTSFSVAVPTKALGDHQVQGLLHELKEHGFQFLENTDFNTIKRSAECSSPNVL